LVFLPSFVQSTPGKERRLNDQTLVETCLLFSRQQAQNAGISQRTWSHVRKTGTLPIDRRGRPEDLLLTQAILDFVSQKPYLATDVVAMALGCSRDKVSTVFKQHKLNFLWQRLRFAGIELKELDPDLIKARSNSIMVDGPGALVHIDAKRYGALQGGLLIVGMTVVDNYSGFTHLFLSPDGKKCGEWSVAALEEFRCLFPANILKIYSDNGSEFVNSRVLAWAENLGIKVRTTKPSHAWSNGKAERTQSMLKREVVIPALCDARFNNIAELADDIDHRMHWYNNHRINGGKANQGLPPHLVAANCAGLDNAQREETLYRLRGEWQASARSQWQMGGTK